MEKKRKIVLASASINRDLLLRKLCDNYEIFKPDIDETFKDSDNPISIVKRFSFLKAKKAKKKYKNSFIISADTVVYSRKKIIDKTNNKEIAIENLKKLSGRSHKVYTGLTFISDNNNIYNSITKTIIKFKNLEEKEILRYIKTEEWKGCAGSYAIQGSAEVFIKFLSGSYSNVVGLPLYEVNKLIKKYNLYK
ncbi:MAG: septum formation protein Maf [Rickettsiales bacterium]|nr:septum formation protein Maf [Rickettsiales bacterium]